MEQCATVNRFCAIEGKHCNKRIPFKGKHSFFFAYPSSPRWHDFSTNLSSELESRGFQGECWEDFVKNDLIFSKVCEGILSHDCLLAEVSEPNSNVLLEIGYALAVGRLPILLQDKNLNPWSRNLLTTLESCFYETREDVHEYLEKLRAQSADSDCEPDRSLSFLENMGIFLEEEVPEVVFHLKPKQSADWISRVDRALKSSYLRLNKMDPSDSIYDEFFTQARQFQRSQLIVASLLSERNVDWEEHNANVSLLIGFAIGLGKQVLVLQHEPVPPILDLGSVVRPIDSERQAADVVLAWIDLQKQRDIAYDSEVKQREIKRQQVDRIRSLYLGHPDALQDNKLLEYFVPTKEFSDAVEGRRTLFVGRRGSGKSANFQAIREELHQNPNRIVAEIAPDDFELERISEFVEHEYAMVNSKLIFQHVWNYVLVLELLKSLVEGSERLYTSPDDPLRSQLRDYYDAHKSEISLDFGSRVIAALADLVGSEPDASSAKRITRAEELVKSLRDYDLNRRLREFAEKEDIGFFIVADDLDKHWRPGSIQSIELLIGLVAEVDKLQRFFKQRLKVVLFLREDIYRVLVRFDDDLPKRNLIRIEWTQANLRHLVAKRLAVEFHENSEDDEGTWSSIFPEAVGGMEASTYILSRSLPRPRDVLDLCQKAIDQAQRNEHRYVTAQDILDGEKEFSDGLLWSLSSEFRGLYSNLDDILIEFAGVDEKLRWASFDKRATGAIERNQAVLDKWVEDGIVSSQFLAGVLFNTGLLGLSKSWTSEPYFYDGRSFSETWKLVGPKPIVHVHPAFRQSLDVSRTGPNPSVIANRRNRIDPRQMEFDELRR